MASRDGTRVAATIHDAAALVTEVMPFDDAVDAILKVIFTNGGGA